MGDRRFAAEYARIRQATHPREEMLRSSDEAVIAALAAASQQADPYFANVLATEAINRVQRAKTITTHLGEGVSAIDAQGRVTFMNPAAERLLGWTLEEVGGRPLHDLVHPECGQCALTHVLQNGADSLTEETSFTTRDARIVAIELTTSPLVREGEKLGAVIVFHDVTARLQSQAEREMFLDQIRFQRARLEAILRQTPAGIVFAEAPSGQVVIANDAVERILRGAYLQPAGSGSPLPPPSFGQDGAPYPPERWPLARALRQGEVVAGEEIEVLRGDGSLGSIRASARPIFGPRREILGAVMALEDVTHRKLAERELTRAHMRTTTILESIADGFLALDASGRFTYANRAAEALLGRRREDILGKRAHDVLSPEERALILRDTSPAPDGGTAGALHHEGYHEALQVWLDVSVYVADEGVTIYLRDVTARKRADEAVRANQERLSNIMETVPSGILLFDREGRITFVNAATCRIFGSERERLLGRRFDDPDFRFYDAAGRRLVTEDMPVAKVFRGEGRVREFEMHVLRPDGETAVVSVDAGPIGERDGGPDGVIASATDVTLRMRREQRRWSESESRYRFLADNALDVILFNTMDGTIRYVSPAARALLGYEPEEMIGRKTMEFIPSSEHERLGGGVFEEGSPTMSQTRFKARRKDGAEVWLEATSHLVLDPTEGQQMGVVSVARDIGDRVKAEAALQDSAERVEALGARLDALRRTLSSEVSDRLALLERDVQRGVAAGRAADVARSVAELRRVVDALVEQSRPPTDA